MNTGWRKRAAAALVLVATTAGQAETFTWDGGSAVDSNWSTGENWNPDGSVPVSASDTLIQLNGGARLTPSQNIAAPFTLNRLEFLGGSSFTTAFNLGGNQLQFVANGTTQPRVYLNRNATCVVNNLIDIPADTTLLMEISTYGVNFTGIISGEGAIDKQTQAGGIELRNGANSFSGGLTIRAQDGNWQKVNIYASGAMGTGPVNLYGGTLNTTFLNPGGLIFNNTTTHANPIFLFQNSPIFAGMTNSSTTAVTLNGDLSLDTYTLHLRGGGTGVINGIITGTGVNAITKSDPGTWTLSGANTFTGRVTVGGGTFKLGTPEALSPMVPLTAAGGVLDLNGFTVTNSGVSLQGGAFSNGALYATSLSSLSGGAMLASLAGSAGVTKSGTGTLVLSLPNIYEGPTTVSAGTLQIARRVSLYGGDTAQWNEANILVSSGASLALNVGGAGEFTDADLDIFNALGAGAGGFLSGSTWGFDTTSATDGSFIYGAEIGNPGGNVRGLTKLGAGTLELSGLNTYTGPTRLDSGTLSVSSLTNGGFASGIGMSGPHRDNLVFAGGTLRYTGPSTRTDRGFKYAVNTNFYAFDVTQPETVLTFGAITNAVFDGNNTTIKKTGPGTLVFARGSGTVYNFPVKAIHVLGGKFTTETGNNNVQHNLHSLASQGPALVLGDGAEMGFNNPLENYVNGDEMMVQYIGTQTRARVTAGNWLLCGPTTNSVGDRLYNTHIFDINDGADDVDLDIQGMLGIYSSIANSYVRKTGAGTLRLNSSSSTFRGTTIVRSGRLLVTANVPYGGNSVLGNCTNDVVIGDAGTLAGDNPTFAFEGPANSSFTFARGIVTYATGGTSTIGGISNNAVTFSGPILLGNTLNVASASTGANAVTLSGEASGPGGLTKTGPGVAVLAAANTYAGATTVAEGTLRLGASGRIADASALRLTGGRLELNGFSETVGALDVDGTAELDFGAGGTLTCADSSAETWDGTLILRGWNKGAGRLFVGDSASLSAAQLAKITSPIGETAAQLSTGEVVLLPLGTVLMLK